MPKFLMWFLNWLEGSESPNPDPPSSTEIRRKRITELSPFEIRTVAARYNIKVTGQSGNTWLRILFFALCGSLCFNAIAAAVSILFGWVPFWLQLGIVLGAWVALFLGVVTRFLFYIGVPQLIGVKAMNYFTGRIHTYTPGANIRYPWEIITKNDYLTLRSDIITRPVRLTTKDGIGIDFNDPMLRWRVFPPLLVLNASHSVETVEQGAVDIFETTLSNEVIHADVAELRTSTKLAEIQAKLISSLEGKEARHVDALDSTFEEQYGVVAEIPALGPPKLSKDYAEALEGQATMRIYKNTAEELVKASHEALGTPTMEFGHAMNNVMINAKENVKKDIFEIQVDDNTRQAAKDLGSALGPVISGATALARKKPIEEGTVK